MRTMGMLGAAEMESPGPLREGAVPVLGFVMGLALALDVFHLLLHDSYSFLRDLETLVIVGEKHNRCRRSGWS